MVSGMTQLLMDRREAVKKLLDGRDGAMVVSGLGSPSYDVHAAGDVDKNFYLWGAMGGAALTGLGLAQAQRDNRVMVITGDGEQLMAFGALATIAVAAPKNLDIIVLDNQHFGETNIVWVAPITNLTTKARLRDLDHHGFGIAELAFLEASKCWPQSGFQLCAAHIKKGYRGTWKVGQLAIPK